MLILRDPQLSRGVILQAVPKLQWRAPSISLPRDEFGNTDSVRFRLTARTHDGKIVWRGWFEDRDDADAFLEAMAFGYIDRALWDLPTPSWPGLDPGLAYHFDTVITLTTTNASNQTWTVPADWNSSDNLVEVIASGGSGGARRGGNSSGGTSWGSGGGAGAYSAQPNISLTPSGSATYRLSLGGASVAATGSGTSTPGNDGADVWFNGTTLAGASVGAKAGLAGAVSTGTTADGGLGGAAASGVGAIKYSGGRGGNCSGAVLSATGGGGAAGESGNGNNGTDGNIATAGGSGNGVNSGNGSSGASSTNTSAASSSNGGNYGAGSAGVATRNTGGNTGNATSGNGAQALIVITYGPPAGGLFAMF